MRITRNLAHAGSGLSFARTRLASARKRLVSVGLSCLSVFAVAGPAFGQNAAQEEGQKAAPAAAEKKAAANNKVTIKVLEQGAAPRQELRYKYREGSVENMVMEMDTAMKMTVNGQPLMDMSLPTIRMVAAVKVTDVTDDGNASVEVEFTGGDIIAKPDTQPQVADAMRAELKKVTGTKGTMVVTPRGEVTEAKFEVPPEAGPQMREQMANTERQMMQMVAPFPAEPLGKGAKWQVTMPVDVNNMQASQTITYTITEQADGRVALDMGLAQTAPKQEIQLPQGPVMQLLKLESTGTGSATLDLAKLVPDSTANLDMDMEMAQQEQRLVMDMKMGMTIKQEKKE